MTTFLRDFLADGVRTHGWTIGEHSYGTPSVQAWGADGGLTIGKYCSFGGGVEILLGGNHRIDWVTTYPFNVLRHQAHAIQGHPTTRGDVRIGNDIWIGQNATILSGVKIGDGAVVATRSVVAKDVPPYGIVAGNPARLVRLRFDEAQVAALLGIRWWDWPDELVDASLDRLLAPDIDAFIAYAHGLGRASPSAGS